MTFTEAFNGMRANDGGPFGAIIVKGNEIIWKGHNTVLKAKDPTAHAEVNAIRHACQQLENHHLTGAVLYSNFEPCPMCLAATYWADIRTVYFSAGRAEAEKLGFMDKQLYEEFRLPTRKSEMIVSQIALEEYALLKHEWLSKDDRTVY